MACNIGYTLDSNGDCVKTVNYCSFYKIGVCSQCIDGYYLINNICIDLPIGCVAVQTNGFCKQCDSAFTLANGICTDNNQQSDSATSTNNCQVGQYMDNSGYCIDGNVLRCATYSSPSGNCASCIDGFSLKGLDLCCLNDNSIYKFVGYNGYCVLIDPYCQVQNDDESCKACKDGYIFKNGLCWQVNQNTNTNSNLQTDTSTPANSPSTIIISDSTASTNTISTPSALPTPTPNP